MACSGDVLPPKSLVWTAHKMALIPGNLLDLHLWGFYCCSSLDGEEQAGSWYLLSTYSGPYSLHTL